MYSAYILLTIWQNLYQSKGPIVVGGGGGGTFLTKKCFDKNGKLSGSFSCPQIGNSRISQKYSRHGQRLEDGNSGDGTFICGREWLTSVTGRCAAVCCQPTLVWTSSSSSTLTLILTLVCFSEFVRLLWYESPFRGDQLKTLKRFLRYRWNTMNTSKLLN